MTGSRLLFGQKLNYPCWGRSGYSEPDMGFLFNMKQINMFGEEFENKLETQYENKIELPTYEPKNKKPNILSLVDNRKTIKLINEIKLSNVTEEEKLFLIESARRHTIFNYQNIADYYAHATKEMQVLMENQALVIIDFNKAYKHGYIKLAQEIANQYFDLYGK